MQLPAQFIGIVTLVVAILYLITDGLEVIQAGFSSVQLYLTYATFVATPFMILGLHVAQRPKVGWVSLTGAIAYAVAFIFYAGTALYALIEQTENYDLLVEQLGGFYLAHSVLLIVGGILFGIAVLRARFFPRWTGFLLITSLVFSVIFFIAPLPDRVQIVSSTLRNVAFLGMAIALLRSA